MSTTHAYASRTAVCRAIAAIGSQLQLANRLGITQGAVSQWTTGRTRVAPEHVLRIERLCGVPRHELRPDIYPIEQAS